MYGVELGLHAAAAAPIVRKFSRAGLGTGAHRTKALFTVKPDLLDRCARKHQTAGTTST